MVGSDNRPVLLNVVGQHAEESASLRGVRAHLIRAPGVNLRDLRRCDDRLAAHLDGLAVAGVAGLTLCDHALERTGVGEAFTLAVRSIEEQDTERLNRLLALAGTLPAAQRGLNSAFGWVPSNSLRGTIKHLLRSSDATSRYTGITACALHRVDPGIAAARLFEDPNPEARARSLRCAGELGRREFVSTCAAAMSDEHPDCQFWAAWSAVILGDRQAALQRLMLLAFEPGFRRAQAFALALQAANPASAHERLQSLAQAPDQWRWLLQGAGFVGDPAYSPWLIRRMGDKGAARLAGESFSLITGTDLRRQHLHRNAPSDAESGPSDDPAEEGVAMDEDEGLPWPDPAKVQAWWNSNGERFHAGRRYFMGEPVSRDNCIRVLKNGYQRQRIAAAVHLSLINPGETLFEWRAPAWRQQRLLGP
jgi:uncharacterized protein (TIGR02270 family)